MAGESSTAITSRSLRSISVTGTGSTARTASASPPWSSGSGARLGKRSWINSPAATASSGPYRVSNRIRSPTGVPLVEQHPGRGQRAVPAQLQLAVSGEPAQPEPSRLARRPDHGGRGLVQLGPDRGPELVLGFPVQHQDRRGIPLERARRERSPPDKAAQSSPPHHPRPPLAARTAGPAAAAIRAGPLFPQRKPHRRIPPLTRDRLAAWVSTGIRCSPAPWTCGCAAPTSARSGPGSPPGWPAR